MQGWGLKAPIKSQLEVRLSTLHRAPTPTTPANAETRNLDVTQAILQDYPGGQLQDEALQNAEDSGATEFALMLDMRRHTSVDPRLAGPAFFLIDNGSGFDERQWKSLQNLHRSEKAEYARTLTCAAHEYMRADASGCSPLGSSPREIGRYGMGSRSYFHYCDVTTVVSRGKYVGLDPIDVVETHGRGCGHGGW